MRTMSWVFSVGVVMALAACGDDGGAGGASAPAPVVIRTDPASASDCADGGSVVVAGPDRNGNMVLDADEVQQRMVVCNPPAATPGPVTVLRLVDEPAGANCAAGGTAVQTGQDGNGNGALDDDEVAHTDYVCGDRLVTRLEAELPGDHCVAGGVAVEAGPDVDHDGVLDDEEVAHIDYVCGDVLSRSVTVRSAADAAALANITAIEGTLTIDPAVFPDDGEIWLPRLQHIRDFLTVIDTAHLGKLHLPRLEEVSGYVSIARNASLTVLDTPRLRVVGNSMFIGSNPKLEDLAQLRALDLVGADLTIVNNAAMATLPLTGPRIGGRLDIEQNPALAELDMFFVDALDRAIINNNAGLSLLRLSSFALHRPKTTLGNLQVSGNPGLTKLDVLLSGQLGDVTITNNAGLAHVTLFADEVTGNVVVRDDPSLGELYLFKDSSLNGTLELHGGLTVMAPLRYFGSFNPLKIDGPLTLDGTHLTSLRIVSVGGTLRLAHNTELTGNVVITDGIGGGLEVVDNPSLLYLDVWSQPTTINGDVIVTGNPKIVTTEALFSVRTVEGNVTIADNAALRNVWVPELTAVTGSYTVRSNPVLTDVLTAKLDFVADLNVYDNVALQTLDLPSLTRVHAIRIDSNFLRQLTMPVLATASSMSVTNNRQLPTCQIEAIFAKIPNAFVTQSNNDDAGSCP